MKIIFAGTPEFAVPALQALLDVASSGADLISLNTKQDKFEVVMVLTQPDRPAGRSMQIKASPIKQLALQHHLNVFQRMTLSWFSHVRLGKKFHEVKLVGGMLDLIDRFDNTSEMPI